MCSISAMGGRRTSLSLRSPGTELKANYVSYGFFASLTLVAATNPSVHAENCVAGWIDAHGESQTTPVVINFASEELLNAAALPQGASSVACPRDSVVPLPEDIRVLTELGVSLGLVEEGGRSLWIWSQSGLLQTTVDNGDLSPAEVVAVNRWSAVTQPRFEDRASTR